MQFTEWSQDFEVGITAIDQDHQTLFSSIRQLGEQISAGHGAERVNATINSLLLYVDEHFEREERFMIRAGYPEFEAHKKEHDSFRDAVFSLRDFHEQNPENIDAQKIVKFLEDWLLHHILKVDKDYEPYLSGEKKGDPKLQRRLEAAGDNYMIEMSIPVEKEDHVRQFLALISGGSEEGALIDSAVQKITKIQQKRRETKAKELFGT